MDWFQVGAAGIVAVVIVDRFLKYMLAAKLQVPTDIQERLARIERTLDIEMARVKFRLKRIEKQAMNGDSHPEGH